MVIRAIPDLSAVNAALLAGEVDFATFVDFKDLDGFKRNPKLKVEVVEAANYGYVGVNTKAPKLQDARIRRALAHAIDVKQIVDVVLSGQGGPPSSFVPAPIPGYAKSLESYYPHDVAKAKGLLAEAGASDLSLAIWAPSNGYWPALAELIQGDLGKAGVTASIEKIDPARFGGAVTEGKHESFVWDASQASADPAEFAYSFFLSSNPRAMGRWGFDNKEFDDLVAKQDAELDEAKRLPILEQMQKLILDEVPQIMLYNGRFAGVTSTRAHHRSASCRDICCRTSPRRWGCRRPPLWHWQFSVPPRSTFSAWTSNHLANLVLEDEPLAIAEVQRCRDLGGSTLVDCTLPGIGRNPHALARIARATGLNIVMGTGYYVTGTHPASVGAMTEVALAQAFVAEVRSGADGTDIRAGFIGEIGASWPLATAEAGVLHAAGLAQTDRLFPGVRSLRSRSDCPSSILGGSHRHAQRCPAVGAHRSVDRRRPWWPDSHLPECVHEAPSPALRRPRLRPHPARRRAVDASARLPSGRTG